MPARFVHLVTIPAPTRRGYSLIETTISVLIVSLVLVSVLQLLGASAKAGHVRLHDRKGQRLAESLMSEILQHAYEEPKDTSTPGTPEPGEATGTRKEFDDIDDFHLWVRTPPQDPHGVPIADAAGWTREAHVKWIQPADLTAIGSDTGLKEVRVIVTSPGGAHTNLTALRSSAGPSEWATSEWTYTSRACIELQPTENPASRISTGIELLNDPRANLLVNGDLESGLEPWGFGAGVCTLEVLADDPHGGLGYLRSTNRLYTYSGPRLEITDRVDDGTTYEVAFWARMVSSAAPISMRIKYDYGVFQSYDHQVGPTIGADWTPVSFTFTAQHGFPHRTYFHVETGSGTAAFDVDDLTVYETQ
ncbi:MAG: hypothetical protein GY715_03035 [Planctomycetes bacterium]|nr:hypothetical protein [Planctomycetota bacterium]